MDDLPGQHRSLWSIDVDQRDHPPLDTDVSVDVAVVGGGITGLTTPDGRVTIMMPHPERVARAVTNSWRPDEWQEDGAWMRLFRNARAWVD